MKRTIAFTLAAVLLLALLGGCGGTQPQTPAPTAEPAPTQTAAAPTEMPAETPAATPELAPVEEYFLEKELGTRQLTLYWNHPSADYASCDVWMWYSGKDGSGYPFYPCAYGVKCMINVPEDVDEVGFIVRRDCSEPGGSSWGSATKDYEDDRFAILTGDDTVIYLKPGDAAQYTSADGGATLSQIRLFTLAGILSPTEIRYYISPAETLSSPEQVQVYEGGTALEIASVSSLGKSAATGVITLAAPLDVSKAYEVEIEGYGRIAAFPTEIFDSPEFIAEYVYNGDDLGAIIHGDKTIFKLWAPTASRVVLNLFETGDGGEAYRTVEMVKGDKGVWSMAADCGHGTYYTYTVTTSAGTAEAVDPYARAAGVNGDRGMVVDLSLTDPEGFRDSGYYGGLRSYEDAVIWEIHVRDFSNTIAASEYPGKYLAFTETGLTNESGQRVGVDYLKWLGITHVHLQPVYDYATVDEARLDEAQFNWGYDPKNYNVPEGSYSTDPYHGEVRIGEFKQMVQALHENNMGVVMDVVYNHTYALDSNLNRIVPYYYYRFNANGAASNGSGCGNETASDRAMFRKYMVDSVVYWASEYKVDGFRFDLMALHDLETMQAIESAVHEINPQAILYGEGWTGGGTPLAQTKQANQANIHTITATGDGIGAVAVFNDAIRDGLKGSVFEAAGKGYINGAANRGNAEKVAFGIRGGAKSNAVSWYVDNAMSVNYMSAHDNNTLWDKLAASNPDATTEEKLAMTRFGAAIVMLSRGTPFFLAGEEMLRTKDGDSNSYASSDAVNNLDWAALTEGSDALAMAEYYRALIGMRGANAFFTGGAVNTAILDGSAIEVTWRVNGTPAAYAVINPGAEAMDYTLPVGNWTVLLQDGSVAPDGGETLSGGVSVAPMSVLIVRK